MIDTDVRRLIRMHLDQALSLAMMLDETLLVALMTEASEYCEAHGFLGAPVSASNASLQ